VSEANPLQPTGRPDVDGAVQGARKGAAGAKDVVTPYGSIEEVKAAQKAWLRRLELAWLAGSEQILDWAVGLQSEEALGTLKQLSLREENYKAADLDELAVKVPAALAPADKILLAGAIEARRNFELMRTALTQAPIHPEKPKDGTYKDLPIMGKGSVHRTLETQVKMWERSMKDATKDATKARKLAPSASDQQKVITDGRAAPGMSRHGYGTEFDVGDGFKWNESKYKKEFGWLSTNAHKFGFFKPYQKGELSEEFRAEYKEPVVVPSEFWHWSYYPVSQAIWEVIHKHWETYNLGDKLKDRIRTRIDEKKIEWVLDSLEMLHDGVNTKLPGE